MTGALLLQLPRELRSYVNAIVVLESVVQVADGISWMRVQYLG